MGNDPAYYQKVIDRVKTWIPEDNEYMDAFLCQGKMPIQVRRRYEEMAKSGQNIRTDSGYDPKFRPGDAASGSGR